jgi:hypothetical protein
VAEETAVANKAMVVIKIINQRKMHHICKLHLKHILEHLEDYNKCKWLLQRIKNMFHQLDN